jgi:outer membrane autotransporter protein
MNAYAPTGGGAGAGGEAVAAIGEAAPTPQSPLFDPVFGDLAFWSSGSIKLGTYDNGAINLESTLVGVSAGVDYRFSPDLAGGIGLGYGRDFTRIGTMGSRSAAESVSMAVYGSYRPAPGFFIDGVAGYGVVSFDSQRFVAATGDLAMGLRYGDQYFGTLTFGYEYSEGGLRMSPYGRLAGSKSTLDGFVESGAGIWDLAYGQQTVDSLAGVLGLRLEYDIPMEWGMLTPRGRIEYSHDFVGSSAASIGYADTGTLPYLLNVDGLATDHLALELGIDARFGGNASVGLDYGISFGLSQGEQAHRLGARMSAQF